MLFNSLQFLLFFIIVTLTYFVLPHRYRWIFLLVASCFFYMSFIPVYILILGFTILIDYFAGIMIEKSVGHKRKLFLIASLVANIGVLAVFKYYNFLLDNVSTIIGNFHLSNPLPALKIILPIGLSFHTFQAMSYTIEVYRGKQVAERKFGIFALYVMFYPQLVAGPIERPQNLLHQFKEFHQFDFERFKNGFTLIAFGLFKKVVIADRLSLAVDYSYSNINTQSGLSLMAATFFYAFQIYCDFSGYSDIAIGSAQIMGFKLMDNFQTPYFSKSITEFWHRWHISLSTWFRDYLYIPLGGSRVKISRLFFNLFIVFFISGLWHGANWTFLIWGSVHGLLMILTIIKNKALVKFNITLPTNVLFKIFNITVTFSLVCLAWVFFRSPNVNDAFHILQKISQTTLHDKVSLFYYRYELIFCLILIFSLCIKEKYWFKINVKDNWKFYLINIAILFGCYFFGVFNLKQFIYFQF
jgi:alginate O-acetyltransferase complex protein AlgI